MGESWIERFVRPVMHEFTGRSADRLADACVDEARRQAAKQRARELRPGVPAESLYKRLFGDGPENTRRQTVFVRRKGRAGGGVVAAKIERTGDGGFSVNVRPHEQTPAELAELAEQIEALVAVETAEAAGIRLGRRLAGFLDAGAGEGRSPVLAGRLHLGGGARKRPGMGPVALRGSGGRAAIPERGLGGSHGSRDRWSRCGNERRLAWPPRRIVQTDIGAAALSPVLRCAPRLHQWASESAINRFVVHARQIGHWLGPALFSWGVAVRIMLRCTRGPLTSQGKHRITAT